MGSENDSFVAEKRLDRMAKPCENTGVINESMSSKG